MSLDPLRYTARIDLKNVNDPHILALGRVPANSRVLDLGTADGSVAAVLQRMGCRVWGVEMDQTAGDLARPYCEEVVIGDLNGLNLAECFGEQRFDVVLMLDILEHLVQPARILKGVGEVLAPGGWGVISLPNVAHLSLRLELADGRFTYRDTGLLDRTHLRFFDRSGVDDLLNDAGWEMFDLARVTRAINTTEIQIKHPDLALLDRFDHDIEARTYQFVISAAPAGSAVLQQPPVLPAAAAQEMVLTQEQRTEAEVARLRREAIPGLAQDLEAIRQASLDRRRQLTELLVALQSDTERLRRIHP